MIGGTEGMIILKWALQKQVRVWTGSVWLRVGTRNRQL
jgi:hypothetical protein